MLTNEKQWHLLHANSYYQHSTNLAEHSVTESLSGSHRADVGIIGGGYSGLSAGLELAKRGYRVHILEAKKVGFGASGRNGGQVLVGYACEQYYLEKHLGMSAAKHLWDLSIEGIKLLKSRIKEYNINCDYVDGFYYAGTKSRDQKLMKEDAEHMSKHYDFHQTYIPHDDVHEHIRSSRYYCALQEDVSGHLHPLNYQLGLAKAATDAGCIIHEHAEVEKLTPASATKKHQLTTENGELLCDYVLLAGNALLGKIAPEIKVMSSRILPVGTYIGASAPISDEIADKLITNRRCVCDNDFVLDYYRLSKDNRMIFGGRVDYLPHAPSDLHKKMQEQMAWALPQLENLQMDFAWGGYVDVTMNRAPHFGQLKGHDSIYFLQGFSGHGVALTGLAGKLVAEAIAGQAERFNAFTAIRHRPFPGGEMLHAPLYSLGMLYYRLRDLF